jgi:hypothetical protein
LELNKALGSDPFQGELMDVAYSIIFAWNGTILLVKLLGVRNI